MNHQRTTLVSDDEHDLALERCECGQYALSVGPVTLQLEEVTLEALARLLAGLEVGFEEIRSLPFSMPLPPDVQ